MAALRNFLKDWNHLPVPPKEDFSHSAIAFICHHVVPSSYWTRLANAAGYRARVFGETFSKEQVERRAMELPPVICGEGVPMPSVGAQRLLHRRTVADQRAANQKIHIRVGGVVLGNKAERIKKRPPENKTGGGARCLALSEHIGLHLIVQASQSGKALRP